MNLLRRGAAPLCLCACLLPGCSLIVGDLDLEQVARRPRGCLLSPLPGPIALLDVEEQISMPVGRGHAGAQPASWRRPERALQSVLDRPQLRSLGPRRHPLAGGVVQPDPDPHPDRVAFERSGLGDLDVRPHHHHRPTDLDEPDGPRVTYVEEIHPAALRGRWAGW